jgi:hypothetical protein
VNILELYFNILMIDEWRGLGRRWFKFGMVGCGFVFDWFECKLIRVIVDNLKGVLRNG